MATTTVPAGTTSSFVTVSSGNELDVSGTANSTTVLNGGNQTVEVGGVETNAVISAGGVENLYGSGSGDLDYGTIVLSAASGGASSTAVLNGATVESGGKLNVTLKGALVSNTTVLSGGLLTISGNAAANGTVLDGGTLDLQSPKADSTNSTGVTASGALTFGSGYASRLQIDVAQTGSNGTNFAQTISGFAQGDVIDLAAITGGTITSNVTSGGNSVVTVSGTSGGSETFTFVGAAPAGLSTQTDPTTGGTDLFVCYASGTLIRTTRGEVAVEHLAVGDMVITASGARRPITWLGHRVTDCARHPSPRRVWPVRVRRGALGNGLPYADLWLSPGHALCLDGVLIPVRCLIQGDAVTQVERDNVTYWHVELGSHDILIANGVPAESYLDTGNRRAFDNAPGPIHLHPDFEARATQGFCRPLVESGPLLSAARARLFGTATGGLDTSQVHLVADGAVLHGMVGDDQATFVVPAGTRELRLVSPRFRGDGNDKRMLGVLVGWLTIETAARAHCEIALDDPGLFAGFHQVETSESGSWRWTDGAGHLAASLWSDVSGAFVLKIGGLFSGFSPADAVRIAC